jgi:hypothetical protein
LTTKSLGLSLTKTALAISLIILILLSSGFLASAASNKDTSSKTRLDIFTDSACKHKLDSIDWGSISPGESINKTVYVKNSGTTALTLSLEKTNWYPVTISSSITCVWDREQAKLEPGKILTATLTLTTAANFSVETSFGMNVVITGTT